MGQNSMFLTFHTICNLRGGLGLWVGWEEGEEESQGSIPACLFRGVIPGGAGGLWPSNFWPTTLFSGFPHTTDRKVPSEVVLMGSFSTELVRSYVSHIW